MAETFPHFYEDGYVLTNQRSTGWPIVFYCGLYKETNWMPHAWNRNFKSQKPVAIFVMSQWRTPIRESGKLWYGCDVLYKYSAN